ncbi:hypothetical protein BST61_g2763 [Cercospora zeina]
MKFYSLILAAATAVSAAIVPIPALQPRQASSFCGTVASRCTGTSQQAQLTAYCSSYLRIPRSTSTRTITVATARPTITLTVQVVGTTTLVTTINVTRTISATSTTNIALAVATVTTRQTTTIPSTRTTTITRTSVTRTITVQPPDVTQMVSKCVAPPNPDAAITIMRVAGEVSKREKREAEAEPNGIFFAKDLIQRQAVAKPSCLTRYTSAYRQSSACSCASIRPATTTTTRSITVTSTSTSTLRLTTSTSTISSRLTSTVATVTQFIATQTITRQSTSTFTLKSTVTSIVHGPSVTVVTNVSSTRFLPPQSTSYILTGPAAQPTFYIQNDQLNYAFLQTPDPSPDSKKKKTRKSKKLKRDIAGTIVFDSIPPPSADAQLFSLPLSSLSPSQPFSGPLTSPDKSFFAAESIDPISADGEGYDDIDVQFVSADDISSGAFGAVSCAVMGGAGGTCPLQCGFNGHGSGDVSQGDPFGNWMLGQPGVSGSEETWGVWAVTP